MKSFFPLRKQVVLAILLGILSFDLYPQTFADRTAVMRNNKVRSSTITLRDALFKLKNHYRIDILFEDKLLEGIMVGDSLLDLNKSAETNMEAIFSSTGLHYQKMKE